MLQGIKSHIKFDNIDAFGIVLLEIVSYDFKYANKINHCIDKKYL